MIKLLTAVDNLLKWFLAWLMAGIVLVVCWQVVSRFLLSAPSSITEELSRCLLLWIGMIGAAFAYRTGVHLGLDILTRKLSPNTQYVVAVVLTTSVAAFAFTVMVIGGGHLVWLTFELDQMSAALGVKMAYIYTAIPMSGLLITFYGCCQLLAVARRQQLPAVEGLE